MIKDPKELIQDYIAERKKTLKEYFSHNQMGLIVLRVGDDPASLTYVKGKMKDGAELGIYPLEEIHLPVEEDVKKTEEKIMNILYHGIRGHLEERAIRRDLLCYGVHGQTETVGDYGIIVQLPLPKGFEKTSECVKHYFYRNHDVDVDGFMTEGSDFSSIHPCTPQGILDFLDWAFNLKTFKGANAVVIGRSEIVGKPMAKMLLDIDCTVTVCHSKTPEEELRKHLANADLIICAAGQQHLLKKEWSYRPTAIVMDVGINRDADGHLQGDCERDLPVAFQSPVPGGVGLLTRIAIFENLRKIKEIKKQKRAEWHK